MMLVLPHAGDVYVAFTRRRVQQEDPKSPER